MRNLHRFKVRQTGISYTCRVTLPCGGVQVSAMPTSRPLTRAALIRTSELQDPVERFGLCSGVTCLAALPLHMDWLERLRVRLPERRQVQTRDWDEDGLNAVEGETRSQIAWTEIRQIYAYKKDCLAFDQLRVIFLSDRYEIEFTEDDRDFAGLCAALSDKFKLPCDWHHRLMLAPAFETTFTALYPTNPGTTEARSASRRAD